MKRGLKICLVILVTVFNCLICFGQVSALENEDEDNLKIGLQASLWFDLRTSHSVKGVKNIPLKIRNVPVHPRDEWLREYGGPIEDDNVEIPQEVDWLSASLGVKRTILSNVKLGGGVKARLVHGGCYISEDDRGSPQLAEREYYNVHEAYAGTYYGVEMKENCIFEPYLELGVDITEELYLYGEASIRQFHLQAENGWHRFMDEMEEEKLIPRAHYTLAKIREINFSIGIAVGESINVKLFKLYMGITILNRPELFSVAKDIQIDYSNISFFVGLAIGGDFTFKII